MGSDQPSDYSSFDSIAAEYGTLTKAPPVDQLKAWVEAGANPCSSLTAKRLDGAWYVVLEPVEGGGGAGKLHGSLRIEDHLATGEIRLSADLYSFEPVDPVKGLDRFDPYWYPHLPHDLDDWSEHYRYYLRSRQCGIAENRLTTSLPAHPWSSKRGDFGFPHRDSWLVLSSDEYLYQYEGLPPTIKLFGRARLKGTLYNVTACKTSPYYRGCTVTVIEMAGTNWPRSAEQNGRTVSFDGVFAGHGIDTRIHFQEDEIRARLLGDTADDERLLNRLMPRSDANWHMTMIVGTKGARPCARLGRNYANDRVLGVMRDDRQPFREYAIGFYGESIPEVLSLTGADLLKLTPALRDDPVGTNPLAFLRTLLHEAGHVFGLLHSDEDMEPGRTLMNPTGDVLDQLKKGEIYPDAAEFRFSDREATALVHAPDPQVAPGRGAYRWMPGLVFGTPLPPDMAWRESSTQEVPLAQVFRRG